MLLSNLKNSYFLIMEVNCIHQKIGKMQKALGRKEKSPRFLGTMDILPAIGIWMCKLTRAILNGFILVHVIF